MELAARYNRPIIAFVDTPGAACTPDAEERGISEAIARNQLVMSQLPVPIIAVIQEKARPAAPSRSHWRPRCDAGTLVLFGYRAEACASILYRDPTKATEAAESLKLTAQDAKRLGVIEEIIPNLWAARIAIWVDVPHTRRVLDRRCENCRLVAATIWSTALSTFPLFGRCRRFKPNVGQTANKNTQNEEAAP
jgi:acetyl-CoA carboxylase carboxyltransferase component